MKSIMNKIRTVPIYVLLISFSIISLYPLFYMIVVSLEPDTYYLPYPPVFFPKSFFVGNYESAIRSNNFDRYFLNSLYISSLSTVLALGVSTLSGYAFSRFRFPGRTVLFRLYLFTMMVPGLLNIIPQFLFIKSLHLVDTYSGLILFYVGGGIAGNTFFLKQFFEQIPHELEESAILDGAGRWLIYRRIMLPLSRAGIGTLAIFAFTGFWDEFFGALTLIKSQEKRTLPIALKLFQGQHGTDWGLVFAASLIALLPLLVIYIVFQKKFVKTGSISSGLKG